MKPNLGVAVFVGWMTQLGLSALLPGVAIVIGRGISMASGGDGSWGEHANQPHESGWHLTQAMIFLGAFIAGYLAGRLVPRRIAMSAAALFLLVILGKFFEQFPMPPTVFALIEWGLAPSVGIVVGSATAWLATRRQAKD